LSSSSSNATARLHEAANLPNCPTKLLPRLLAKRAAQIGLIAGGANGALKWIHPRCSARRAQIRVGEQHIQRVALIASVLPNFVHANGTAVALFALGLPPFVHANGTAVAIFALLLLPFVFAAPPASFQPHAACKLGIWITNLVRNLGFLNLNRSHSLSDRQWPRLRRDAFGRARVEYSREHRRHNNVSDSRGK